MPLLHVSRPSFLSPRLATVAAVVLLVIAGCSKNDAPPVPARVAAVAAAPVPLPKWA